MPRTEHLFINIFYTSSSNDISKLSLLRGQATFSVSHTIQLLVSCLGYGPIFYLSCHRSMDADLLRHRARSKVEDGQRMWRCFAHQ